MTDVMWSIAQIAARDGISKAAVSKTVKKMTEASLETPVERGAQGQVMRVSLAHYDHYRQRFINPAKATAPLRMGNEVPSLSPPAGRLIDPDETFEEARRQSEWLKVGREKIRHQEDCGQLVRRDMLDAALTQIGTELQAIIRRLPNRADDLAMAVSKEGVHGARVLLRQISFEIGNHMADRLLELAKNAPASDALIDEDDP